MAKAAKYMHKDNVRVYTLLGDGEIEEGEVWEAFLFAAKYKLDNLCVIIDLNGLQIDGPTSEVMPTEPVDAKMRDFGFRVISIDGHDLDQMEQAFTFFHEQKDAPHRHSDAHHQEQGRQLHGKPGRLARQGPQRRRIQNCHG